MLTVGELITNAAILDCPAVDASSASNSRSTKSTTPVTLLTSTTKSADVPFTTACVPDAYAHFCAADVSARLGAIGRGRV
jgi:hypothetical protein